MSLQPARPRWPLVTLRVTAALVALLALAQPVLAGGFLQGIYPLLDAHMMAAMILATAVLLSVVAALLVWRVGGGPSSFALRYFVLLVLCVAQISLGFERVLILHIPLGVGIFVMAEKFVAEVFRSKPDAASAEVTAGTLVEATAEAQA
ncbi:hypothetical protein [Streptacidiphilus jiangxiensis]|uniref:Uncharacterized protein n=1 Tax=Streptacidiphilus jiangxiensis TaxID=235985 RepID=A0A1H7U1F2_STRJI|nr:hypothetical protein [Streptacidiphilus jiangxiensis]SEL90922.1 hypothetical protein SAMN05414137_11528 [Streptacidiphilus jiangxiensis]